MTTVAPSADGGATTPRRAVPVALGPVPATRPGRRDDRPLRPPLRARRLRGRPGRRPPGPALPHAWCSRPSSALEHLAHRGATGSEEDSGDGAGILIQVPDAFYREVVDFPLPDRGRYATGIAFLSSDAVGAAKARDRWSESSPSRRGLDVLGWRELPVEPATLGSIAEAARPSMHQLFIAPSEGTPLSPGDPAAGRRPAGLRSAQAGRARGRRLLLRLPVGADGGLQGDAHLAPAGRVLPRPGRRAAGQRAGPGPFPVLHQHLPVVAARPSLPVHGPQRRDQHPGRQPELDAGPRGPVLRPT